MTCLLAGLYACGGNDEQTAFSPTAKGGSAGSTADASLGGAAGGVNGGSGGIYIEASATDQAMNPESACAEDKVKAEVLPLDLYLMVDRSASMDNPIEGQTITKWVNQSDALKSFFQAPDSQGLWAALKFFPLDNGYAPQDPQCSGNPYAIPQVPWGELPGHAAALTQAVDTAQPEGNFTPTQEAIHGVLKGALQRQLAEPLHVVAAVIVSDGKPCCDNCPIEGAAQLGQVAASYANPNPPQPPIRTFAIYVDAQATDVMTQIAVMGGTTAPFDATAGQAAFIDALKKIQGSALGCEYKMPTPGGGKEVNPALVQVTYTPGTGGDPQTLTQVDSKAACGGQGGWYYDNNAAPTKILLCDSTCNVVRNDKTAEVTILLGCSSTRR
jgi:hypothetical protein